MVCCKGCQVTDGAKRMQKECNLFPRIHIIVQINSGDQFIIKKFMNFTTLTKE